MRYYLTAVGQLKRGFYQEGCELYIKRLRPYAGLETRSVKAKTAALESRALLENAQGYTVALDETGRRFTSAGLAKHLSRLETRGVSTLTLLIGGAQGHTEELKRSVDELWRLSDLTLPHDLAQLVLLEQLYRAETIRAGHPYHKS